jgi:hypothetical protein
MDRQTLVSAPPASWSVDQSVDSNLNDATYGNVEPLSRSEGEFRSAFAEVSAEGGFVVI